VTATAHGKTGSVVDWRDEVLAGISLRPPAGEPVNRLGWPGYDAAEVAVRWGPGTVAGHRAVAVVWDFAVYGGSFGEREATALAEAAAAAAGARRPLVTFLRSGGTRLQEGVAGLVGLPRATLALAGLARAGVAHVAVADSPTTGGGWMTVGSRADLRCAVDGATVGFAGPRVVEATTGALPPPDSHTARSAFGAGLVDALCAPHEVADWLDRVLGALGTGSTAGVGEPDAGPSPAGRPRGGWEQVCAARSGPRPPGRAVLADLLAGGVDLHGPDRTVAARVGRLGTGTAVVGVAVAAARGGQPSAAGYRLLTRAAMLAGRLGLPLVTLVDTPGADPRPASEAAGIAPAIGEAMAAVLACSSATVAVVVGEGGSGGALAAAVADVVLVAPDAYLTALSPEGAAATLRLTPRQAADAAGLRPADLITLGFADGPAPAPGPGWPAGPAAGDGFGAAIAAALDSCAARDPARRRAAREARWSAPLGNRL
jgi:acyl-CoA carboxylase subunit beta